MNELNLSFNYELDEDIEYVEYEKWEDPLLLLLLTEGDDSCVPQPPEPRGYRGNN